MDFVSEIVRGTETAEKNFCPTENDWKQCERELGVVFPVDYKELVSALGSGYYGDGIFLLNPRDTRERARLCMSNLKYMQSTLEFMEEEIGLVLFPKKSGFIWIGGLERIMFFYEQAGVDTLSSLVVYDHDYETIHNVSYSISELLFLLLNGKLSGSDAWVEALKSSVDSTKNTWFKPC